MRIAVGSDHAGFHLKEKVAAHLRQRGHDVVDHGTDSTQSVDYPDFAAAVARDVASGDAERGVVVCGTGQGSAMAANKVKGVRAAVVSDTFSAEMAMAHNDARVLCLGERVTGSGLALACVDAWLAAEFEGGRHTQRVAKIDRIEQER
jgi:ribose 5-phosphate isomerase B